MESYVSSSDQDTEDTENQAPGVGRPRRQPRLPARLAGPEWAHVGSVLKPSDGVLVAGERLAG